MFDIRPAKLADVHAAVTVLGDAFAEDPFMRYFFAGTPTGAGVGRMTFFSLLLRVRIALEMPAFVLQPGDELLGAVMGYDTSAPTWPAPFAEEWRLLLAAVPGLATRLAVYDAISEAHIPVDSHYYLGVIGVHQAFQGRGAGRALLETFCERSRADPKSKGVYLETASPDSLQFYYANGFELSGEGLLGASPMWCLYKPT